jgi:hypothetical protein
MLPSLRRHLKYGIGNAPPEGCAQIGHRQLVLEMGELEHEAKNRRHLLPVGGIVGQFFVPLP